MKNLIIHEISSHPISGILCDNPTAKFAINPDNNDVYIFTKGCLFVAPHSDHGTIHCVRCSNFSEYQDLIPVDIEYNIILEQLCCAYENGDIIIVNQLPNETFEYELVAKVSDGLQCMKFSPDYEIITLVTKTNIVLTMVSDFNTISEVNLNASDFGEKQFITVGWGKKETQFHGSLGKAAATAKPIQSDTNVDDGMPRITWRADGVLFGVSFVHSETHTRFFKIFSREGILQYSSEVTNGLEESLSWKPSGSVIATTQQLVNKHVVALFEKNGLKFTEFSLPVQTNQIKVCQLLWSCDSQILTIWIKNLQVNETHQLQLWMENNAHWYLKQVIKFPKNVPVFYVTWASSVRCGEKQLFIVTRNDILCYTFHTAVNKTKGKTSLDNAVVGVIDGKELLTTSFRMGIVPPPMAHQKLLCPEFINSITFGPVTDDNHCWINSNAFFCSTCDNKLVFFGNTNTSDKSQYEHIKTCEIEWDKSLDSTKIALFNHFLWAKKNTIFCSVQGDSAFIAKLYLDDKNDRVTVEKIMLIEPGIQHIFACSNSTIYFVIHDVVYKCDDSLKTHVPLVADSLSNNPYYEICEQIELVKIGNDKTIINRCKGNRLYVDRKEISNNITSFHIDEEFLLMTTLQNTLICVKLKDISVERLLQEDLTLRPWENKNHQDKSYLNIRRVERGSVIITSIPNTGKVILQMPRGNLECIQPRAMSLNALNHYLNDCNYYQAYNLMRKERINLNLIHDHNPTLFLKNIDKFVQDINNPNWLTLFLSELQNDDVTKTTYANYYSNEDFVNADKVHTICKLLRDNLENLDNSDRFIQPILISLVKNKEIQGLEEALKKIQEIKSKENQIISAENALKYLLYIVDESTLFDVALGLYDFELVMFVADNSQKDPKEYLPFLNNLKKHENEFYMKYYIDVYLKRYERALKNLVQSCAGFDECLSFIRKHDLYKEGLELFKDDEEKYKLVALNYGESLLNQRKYYEAGKMFENSCHRDKAFHAYKIACGWSEIITLARREKLSKEEENSLFRDVVRRMIEEREFKAAADVLQNFLNSHEEAILTLCAGKYWKDAMNIAQYSNCSHCIDRDIKPGVQIHLENLKMQIQENKENVIKYTTRLIKVREQLDKKKFNFDIEDHENELLDNFSDTSSFADSTISQRSRSSTSSTKTRKSSKSKRKQERKLMSLKEGGVYEDLGLMRVLHEIITNTYEQKDEVDHLVEMLKYLELITDAKHLEFNWTEFLNLIEINKPIIWDRSAPSSLTQNETAEEEDSLVIEKLVERRILCPPESENFK